MMVRKRITLAMLLLAGCGGGGGGGGSVSVTPAPTPVPAPAPTPAPSPSPSPTAGLPLPLTGATAPAHDPAILYDGGTFYLFTTGNLGDAEGLIAMRTSTDGLAWQLRGGSFSSIPAWAQTAVPGTSGMWAPDIVKHGNEYRLYYSISTFGRNDSAIGMASATSLNGASAAANWTDRGVVFESATTDNFNAIDPAVFSDASGRMWMALGSFWTGIKLIELDPATGLRKAGEPVRAIASRPFPGAIEAPFVVRRGDFYYLFVSFDSCCQGAASTYNTVVGRSSSPTGPYLDRDGRDMMLGGGTRILSSGQGSGDRYVGRGHVAILQNAPVGGATGDYIVYHAYDVMRNGFPTLQIQRLNWDSQGWPGVG
ncbi:arabinan endo-1,5-alpha-L-arabinosidase [Sphingomonas sp. FW199]|uniref:arabinan endo-1,5-alpha-L-arabinosidase n=1 Tax=Sphingomonas sp. FW199 TaxID=3400217 RepID=UPI003CEC5D87